MPLHGSPTKVTIRGALNGHGEPIATIPSPCIETGHDGVEAVADAATRWRKTKMKSVVN